MKIFQDIWKYATRFKPAGLGDRVVSLIARRRLRGKTVPETIDFGADNRFFKSYKTFAERDKA